jgi:hypothetical protein
MAARTAVRGRRFLLAATRIIALVVLIVIAANDCSSAGSSGYYYSEPSGPPIWAYFLLLLVATAVIVSIVFAFRWSALAKALEIMDPTKNPEQLAAGVGRSVESRLTALDSSNVIVFSGLFCGVNPFVGSGQQIASWGITMDISAADRDDDEPRRIEPFDAADLHDWLAREVPDNTLPGLGARERLYVSGLSAPLVPHLVPQPRQAPSASVPGTVLTNVLRKPTNYARTYLCFEKSAWGGEFVFSYLVRAEILQNKTLFMEGAALVMPPLTDRFLRATKISTEPSARVLRCLRDIASDMASVLFGLRVVRPLKAINMMRRRFAPTSASSRSPAMGTEKDVVVDYGAIGSIRTVTAQNEIPWYFFSVDEEMYLRVLERRILENTVRFLRARGVDTSEFERQQTRIVNKTHFGSVLNINGNVSGSGNVFGDSAQVAQVTQVANARSGGGR